MPHLSPMSWLLALFTFWLLITIFMSVMWWSQNLAFVVVSKSANVVLNKLNWKWLQDGWAVNYKL